MFGRTALDHIRGELAERSGAPVGGADRDHLVDTVDPLELEGDERVGHRLELSEVGLVAVVARHVGEEHATGLAGDDLRHRRAGAESEQHRGLVSEERRDVLQPHSPVSVGILQIDERFQVRTCTGSSVIVTWLAAHARSASGPPGRAYGKRSGSS